MLIPKEVANLLNKQVGNELGAMVHYLAVANYFHRLTLPELAQFFYSQAEEERAHAMKFIDYLHHTGATLDIPPIPKQKCLYKTVIEAVKDALNQEIKVTEQITAIAKMARKKEDFASENFLKFFVDEQIEEISTMEDLVAVAKRAGKDRLHVLEDYIVRLRGSNKVSLSGE